MPFDFENDERLMVKIRIERRTKKRYGGTEEKEIK